ncbi:MAG: integrase core domain-containing protein [Stygiobacter sp.]
MNFGQSFDTLSSEISSYLYRYNYQRRHGSLNYLTPLDCLRNVTELLK